MRTLALSLSLMFAFSSAAFAQQSLPPEPAPVPAAPAAKAVEKVAEQSSEPNLKVLEGSGGKVTSSSITDAPLLGDFVMGKDTAPLVIVEYASLSCPHCAHFSNAVLPEIENKYVKTGKVRYVLRQFPLNEAALKGAMLLDCVGVQDEKKYYTFSRVLFDAQSKWAFDANYVTALETIATVGGVSKDQFQNCINNTDRETRILKAKKEAMDDLKIPHTPYFYIGDEVYAGDRNIEKMSAFIEAKLAQKKNRSWLPKW
ncbi:MAG: DsbA family protein [Alphaproteobacteria bacterium]|nr:DsbA family protein [Alphaproteobacteria bacterium]